MHLPGRMVTAILLLLTGCGQSIAIQDQQIAGSRVPDGPLSADLMLPGGQGPFPVVILLHGCSGLHPTLWDWARRLQSWGYAALVLDSFSARGIRDVCAPDKQPLITPRDRVADVMSAALYLRGLRQIDGARIAVLGQSHGGRTAAIATQAMYQRLYPDLLEAAVDYYGACGPAEAHSSVPLLALAGEADDTPGYPAADCRAMSAKLALNQPFEVQTYPGVWHAFDISEQQYYEKLGHVYLYNSDAAADSFRRVHAFLDTWLMQHPPLASPSASP